MFTCANCASWVFWPSNKRGSRFSWVELGDGCWRLMASYGAPNWRQWALVVVVARGSWRLARFLFSSGGGGGGGKQNLASVSKYSGEHTNRKKKTRARFFRLLLLPMRAIRTKQRKLACAFVRCARRPSSTLFVFAILCRSYFVSAPLVCFAPFLALSSSSLVVVVVLYCCMQSLAPAEQQQQQKQINSSAIIQP